MSGGVSEIRSIVNLPLGDMISRIGLSVSEAQTALDRNALALVAQFNTPENGIDIDGTRHTLIELGFAPTFYAFSEVTFDLRVTLQAVEGTDWKIGGKIEGGVDLKYFYVAAMIEGHYNQKYSFDARAASSVTARLVAVPPPEGLQLQLQRLRGA